MSKRIIKKYHLEFKKTFPYFVEHIGCGKTLSKTIVNNIDFNKGNFFTILPIDVEIDRLYNFQYGGIITPIPYGNETYKIEGFAEEFHPLEVITMDSECSEFILEYLKKSIDNFAIFENYISEINDPYVKIENVDIIPLKKEIYYYLDKNNSLEEIYKTIRKSTQVWHSLIVLSKIIDKKLENLNFKNLLKIIKHTKFLITSAYDGEAHIFWEKNR